MIIGYARVSGLDQVLDRQIESLKEYGCEKIYCDKSTGKNFNRPEYIKLKEMIRPGDVLVVHEFDRLGRNKKLTLKELQYFKDNKIRVVALNLPTTQLNTDDNVMLETINNIVIELYTMIAQQEIETREKRQAEGIRIALEKGIKFGRRKIEYPKEWKGIMELLENKTINNIKAMEILGLKKTTYYRLLKEYKNNID
ncbi:recombinase family protein [Clostridioides difficile]|nr:recombinase family protein [Clostridioides difficile]MBZ0632399.1 recombinase family protein [Clostridioides difficile]MBZ0658258.1 recombinase family protein [Clostridioides difficile]HBF9262879.1 recombinase family protein [Clostridioides difficile]HBF9360001.1 recombinase family protein [Clostridioides difficile]